MKWVYVTLGKGGKREYTYQLEPPPEFVKLTMRLKALNEELMTSKDQTTKTKLFKELQEIAYNLQSMGR